MNAIPAHIAAWSAYRRAEARGDLEEAERQHRRWTDLLLSGSSRADAVPPMNADQNGNNKDRPPAADSINWDNVLSEVGIMLQLNPQAASQDDGQRAGRPRRSNEQQK